MYCVRKNLAAAFLAFSAALSGAAAQNVNNCGQAINFEQVDIRQVVNEIALRTGKKFVLHPNVVGQVTIKSDPTSTICPDEAWELFQAALRVSGFVATPINGDSYRIVPIQEGSRAAGPVGEGRAGDIVTQIVRLRHIDAREAAANLTQIISERGVVAPVRSGNSLILVDTADNVERLQAVLQRIDRDTTVYRTLSLSNASATEVAKILQDLAQEISEEGGGGRSGISVVPVEASNSVLIRAEPSMLDRMSTVVAELDRIGGARGSLSVITLAHADAEELTPLLKELAGAEGAGVDGSAPGRQRATISFHKSTNSIIISGDADLQQTLRNVVSQLDVRRPQVLVEAIIVEISESTTRELGVQYFLTGLDGRNVPFSATDFSGKAPDFFSAIGSSVVAGNDTSDTAQLLRNAALSSLSGLSGFSLGGGRITSDGTIFGAILTAIKNDTNSRVLSTPSVIALDNQEALLSVGQEIPITTGEAIGDNFANAFRTVSREEVGIILEVTPRINEDGTVTLNIRQEKSSIAGQQISSSDLITNKSEISTKALVDDGDVLVLGGLIDQTDEDIEAKVPLLGDIPIAGNLFKSQSKRRDRRNLVVFIRPTVIRDRATAATATERRLNYIRARELLATGRNEAEIDRRINDVTGLGPYRPYREYRTEDTEPSAPTSSEPEDLIEQ